jgi:hypothetical protein
VKSPRGSRQLRSALALGGLIASSWVGAAPLDTLRDCTAIAAPGVSGLKDLGAACPKLAEALGDLGLDAVLYEGWQRNLNVHALHDAIALSERYSKSSWQRQSAPNTAELPAILKALQDQQAPQDVSWWRSFKTWLKEWLAHSDSAVANWLKGLLDRWLGHAEISIGFLQMFTYIVAALTVIAAIVVIVGELRAAGVGRRFGISRREAKGGGPLSDPFEEPAAAALSGPAELLRLLVQRLLQSGRLRAERSLTHRELIARSAFDSETQRSTFAAVAETAESMLYGSVNASTERLEQVTRQGQELLRQLSMPAATQ